MLPNGDKKFCDHAFMHSNGSVYYVGDVVGGCPACALERYKQANELLIKSLLDRDIQYLTLLKERDALWQDLAKLKAKGSGFAGLLGRLTDE